MQNITRLTAAILVFLIHVLPSIAMGGDVSNKPVAPVHISIQRATDGRSALTVRPGDRVDFVVQMMAIVDLSVVIVHIELPAGLDLISGQRQWKGSVLRNEVTRIDFGVRVRADGGRIKVRARAKVGPQAQFTAVEEYDLGAERERKRSPDIRRSKDGKGRDVVEHGVL